MKNIANRMQDPGKLTLSAGRTICKGGVPFVTITKCDGTSPVEADAFARLIIAMHHGLCSIHNAIEQIEQDTQGKHD